jgi:hypothetical protein
MPYYYSEPKETYKDAEKITSHPALSSKLERAPTSYTHVK